MSGVHLLDDRRVPVPATRQGPIHRLAPHAKLVGLVAFVLCVAVTPRHRVLALAADALILGLLLPAAGVRPRPLLARLGVLAPFLALAALLPFAAEGERTSVLGVGLATEGLWAAWNLAAKATLGATATLLVAATTPVPDLLAGLQRLRVPAVLVAIAGSMVRYLHLVNGRLVRMRRAMTARGHDPRWLWQARPIAAAGGAVFVRTYEHGERIHGAMLARGYTGTMPGRDELRTTPGDVVVALLPALGALAAQAATAALG